MDSEADSSLLTPSTIQVSTESGSKKLPKVKRGSAHETWAHTRPARDGEDSRLKFCTHCTESPYSTKTSTNMRLHLKSKHGIKVDVSPGPTKEEAAQQLQQLYSQAESSGQTNEIDTRVCRKHLNSAVITEALVTLTVVRNLPFRAVQWPEFHAFCQTLNPESSGIITTAHSQITNKIGESWLTHKDDVRKKLQSAISSIHLSLDIWTSPNRLLLLGVCAHFVDRSSEDLTKALLALRPIGNHGGDEQFATLIPVLEDYGIQRKLGSIVSDNASSNDTLCRAVENHLREEEGMAWDATRWRVRCIGHIINLAVQAFLFCDRIELERLESYDEQEGNGKLGDEAAKRATFRTLGPLGKLHNIVVHIRTSAGRAKEFKELAGRMIPLDNRTRWNSWFLMLAVADQKAGPVDTYTKNHLATLQADYLSPKDWEQLRKIKDFLQPFHQATLETQGGNATIDRVLFTMDVIIGYLQDASSKHASDKPFKRRIENAWDTFDKYYTKTDESALYAAALVLHPKRRTKYIEANWKPEWIEDALEKVKELWKAYREMTPDPSISSFRERTPEEEELSPFDRIAQKLGEYYEPVSQDEYEDYCSENPIEIGKTPALKWWGQEQQTVRWPRLSRMAFDILSIPAMSDEPERVFSGARRTVSWERAQMGAETLEKVECLKHWKRNGILDTTIEMGGSVSP